MGTGVSQQAPLDIVMPLAALFTAPNTRRPPQFQIHSPTASQELISLKALHASPRFRQVTVQRGLGNMNALREG
jgi:hypothetical protein